jgi:hypothetical protein
MSSSQWTTADRVEAALYAALAVAGVVWPWSYNLAFVEAHGGFEVGVFVAEAFSTDAGASLSADVLVGGTAWMVWMLREARIIGVRAWPYVIVMFLVAFACACPLFMLHRKVVLMARGAS